MDFKIMMLNLITFIDLFAVGLVVPLISNHILKLGGSHFQVGLMGSFYSGLQLFSGPLIGSLSDIKGRKPVFLVTLLSCSLAYLCFGLTNSIFTLLIIRIILGIFKHTQTLSKAFAADVCDTSDHSDLYGKMAAISGAGITLGPLVGGHILEAYPENGFSIASTLTFLLFLLNTVFVYTIQPKKKKPKNKKEEVSTTVNIDYSKMVIENLTKSVTELKNVNWSLYWDAFFLKALSGFSMSVFYSTYSPLLKTRYNLSPKHIGYTISFQGIIGALCCFFINFINEKMYKNDKTFSQRNLHSFIVLSFTFLGLLICNQWLQFIILLIPLAICNAILRLVLLEMVLQKCSENQRGSLIGASNSMRSISGMIGPLIAGSISDTLGMQYVLIVSLLSTSIGVIVAAKHRSVSKYESLSSKKSK